MTLNDLLILCERWNNLGPAVQKQLDLVQRQRSSGDIVKLVYDARINPNAIPVIADFLDSLADKFDGEELGDEAMSVLMSIDEAADDVTEFEDLEFEPEI
jgi:hypothetical protein